MKTMTIIAITSIGSFAVALMDSIHREAQSFSDMSVFGKIASVICVGCVALVFGLFVRSLIKKK